MNLWKSSLVIFAKKKSQEQHAVCVDDAIQQIIITRTIPFKPYIDLGWINNLIRCL